ncbi:hypothetical protein ABPG72_014582 [Tetrahymena utriculariae]
MIVHNFQEQHRQQDQSSSSNNQHKYEHQQLYKCYSYDFSMRIVQKHQVRYYNLLDGVHLCKGYPINRADSNQSNQSESNESHFSSIFFENQSYLFIVIKYVQKFLIFLDFKQEKINIKLFFKKLNLCNKIKKFNDTIAIQ